MKGGLEIPVHPIEDGPIRVTTDHVRIQFDDRAFGPLPSNTGKLASVDKGGGSKIGDGSDPPPDVDE